MLTVDNLEVLDIASLSTADVERVENDLVERYQDLLDDLLERLKHDTITDDDEDERVGQMDDIWKQLDGDMRAGLEVWIADRLRRDPTQRTPD